MTENGANRHGAYGYRLRYPESVDRIHLADLVELDESLPEIRVTWRYATTIMDVEEIGQTHVVYGVRGATTFDVRLEPRLIHMDLPGPVPPGALVHPLLTVGMSIHARWRGDVTLHAGAFESNHGGWGVIGVREAGKSSFLASVGEHGLPVIADDLLTIQDSTVWAGPSCVDLRPDTAERFPHANYLGIVGNRPRYRLSTSPGAPRVRLRGFFLLEWSDRPEIVIELLPARERLHLLYWQEYIRLVGHSAPSQLVPLIGLPTWRLSRPRDWSANEDVIGRVLELTNASGKEDSGVPVGRAPAGESG